MNVGQFQETIADSFTEATQYLGAGFTELLGYLVNVFAQLNEDHPLELGIVIGAAGMLCISYFISRVRAHGSGGGKVKGFAPTEKPDIDEVRERARRRL